MLWRASPLWTLWHTASSFNHDNYAMRLTKSVSVTLSLPLSLLLCACSKPPTPAPASAIVVASAPAAPANPKQQEAALMQAVFGNNYHADRGVAVAELPDPDDRKAVGNYVVSAVAHTVLPDGLTVLVANAEIAGDDGKAESSHASPGLLNVFFLRQQAGKWTVLKRHDNISAMGSFGQLGSASWVKLAGGKSGLAVVGGFTGQGYTTEQLTLFDVSDANVVEVADGVELHSDNHGACGPETNECWDVGAKWSFAAPAKPGPYDDLVLVFSGTSAVAKEGSQPKPGADDVERTVTPVKGRARYAFDGKRYQLVEGENLVPGV